MGIFPSILAAGGGGLVFADPLGPTLAAAAAGILAVVLLWHFVSMLRAGHWRHWTAWASIVLAAITAVWLGALLTGAVFDNAVTKLALLGLLSLATVLIVYHSVFHYLGPGRVSALLLLRCGAMAVLVLLLFKPAWGSRPDDDTRPLLIVMLDRSGSMNEADVPTPGAAAPRMRYTAAVDAILAAQSKAEEYFDVRYYLFDTSAEPVDRAADLADARPAGEGTYFATSLAGVSRIASDQRAEAVILISDGIHNGSGAAVTAVDALPRPLLAVGVGGPVPEGAAGRDVAVARVTAPREVFSNSVTRIEVDVESAGYAGQDVMLTLRDPAAGEVLGQSTVTLADGVTPAAVEFTPRRIGVVGLSVELDALPGESVAGNNAHALSVRVGEPQIKVLYVEGSIRSEYRFLTQALSADQHVELMTLIQLRKTGAGGAQFAVRGTVGGKRLAGMPGSADQFALFDVVILGDLDSTYLSRGQMDAMAEFVREGKGLLMIGGSHSFGPGGYGGTPVEKAMGVVMGPRTIGQETMAFQLELTTAGKVHDILGGLVNYISPPADRPASQLPQLSGCVKVAGVKPGATVLAVHPARKTPDGKSLLPVLTVNSYGKGRSAAFTADTTWRWRMFRTVAAYEGVYDRFWSQLVRWLASSELVDRKQPPAAVLSMPRSYYAPGESIPLSAWVWDDTGQPVDDARVELNVTPPAGGAEQTILLEPSPDSAGLYIGTLTPSGSGKFALTLSARRGGVSLGREERAVEVGRAGAEAARRSANIELLRQMSSAGPSTRVTRYVPLEKFGQLVDELIAPLQQRRLAPRPQELRPSYGTRLHAVAMALFIGLLSIEWFLRRRWQLQ